MLIADATQVIHIEWQSIAALGSILGGAILGGAKILAYQWGANIAFEAKRHDESRTDSREARDENRALSKLILETQTRSIENQGRMAEALIGVQREIERVLTRLDRIEGAPSQNGSKSHRPLAAERE